MSYFHSIDLKQIDYERFKESVNDQLPTRTYDCAAHFRKLVLKETDASLKSIFQVLEQAFSMVYDSNDAVTPYKPRFLLSNGRTAGIHDFSKNEIEALRIILAQIENPQLIARLADIIWIHDKEVDYCHKAIDAYIETAELCLNNDDGYEEGLKCLERSCQLRRSIGSQEHLEKISGIYKLYFNLDEKEPDDYRRAHSFSLAKNYSEIISDIDKVTDGVLDLCVSISASGDYRKARSYLKTAKEIQDRKSDTYKKIESKIADSYLQEVKFFEENGAQALLLITKYEKAIEVCRRTPGYKEKADKLIEKMRKIQPKVVDEMKPISVTVDVSDSVKAITEAVGKTENFDDCIALIAAYGAPFNLEKFKTNTSKKQKGFMHSYFAGTVYSDEGRTVARKPPLITSQTEEGELIDESNLRQTYSMQLQCTSFSISFLRQEIYNKYPTNSIFFDDLLEISPFVPTRKIGIFRRGLLAGLNGDLLVSSSLLIPQIENSIREIIAQNGGVAVSFTSAQVDKVKSLNQVLDMPLATKIFGEDMIYCLKVLLTESLGINARNDLAHGLLNDNSFSAGWNSFLWALTVRLCLIGKILNESESEHEK